MVITHHLKIILNHLLKQRMESNNAYNGAAGRHFSNTLETKNRTSIIRKNCQPKHFTPPDAKAAVIVVCNKLLKQVFGCVKNKSLYQDNYLKNIA